MKTNVVMIRPMGQFKVQQRTKDSMFNATSLLKQWNSYHGITRGKEVNGFLKTGPTKEFIEALKKDENLNTNQIVLKSRGKNGGTWMHPYLFMDFAMWINPKFKLEVIKFVYDQLIESRHQAGDNYKVLSASGTKLPGYDFAKVAKAMQWIVFNKTGKGLRQMATTEQLKEIADIEQKLAFAIDMGYIKSFKHLIQSMRDMWTNKYTPSALSA